MPGNDSTRRYTPEQLRAIMPPDLRDRYDRRLAAQTRPFPVLSAAPQPTFNAGHGAHHETGGLKAGKTELRPSGAASVVENWSKRTALGKPGSKTQLAQGDRYFLVPTRSGNMLRMMGTHEQKGNFPSLYPVDAVRAKTHINVTPKQAAKITHRAHSPGK